MYTLSHAKPFLGHNCFADFCLDYYGLPVFRPNGN